MNTPFNLFKSLHSQPEPLLIGNVWNVQSARVFEKLKFKAIATSSAAVAETLGYTDGEQMSFDEYLFIIKRIKASCSLPLSVDLEAGYGKSAEEIAGRLRHLHALGIVGVNIEDSVVENGNRSSVDAHAFAEKLSTLVKICKADRIDLFINVRCDAFLLGLDNARTAAIHRIKRYDQTGIDGLFLPCITDEEDIKAIVSATPLPVNVMCMPQLAGFHQLKTLGVKRISMGNFMNSVLYAKMEALSRKVVSEQHFSALLNS